MRHLFQIFILVLCSMFSSISTAAETFQEGKQYKVIPNAPATNEKSVVEFFSYKCPACNQFEPTIEAWVAKKPKEVAFERVPVIFDPSWEPTAKAYYTAQSLGQLKKLHPAIFKAIHLNGRMMTDEKDVAAFFAEHGVSQQAFNDVYKNMPSMSARLHKGKMLLDTYEVRQVPTVVVNGRYRVSRGDVPNDEEFIQVINFLLKK